MKIVVLVKTVTVPVALPGSSSKGAGAIIAGTTPRAHAINPLDELAIEEALRIKDEVPGSDVTVVSLGGAEAEVALRRGVALGADKAVHVVSDDAAAWDSWVTASALKHVLRRIEFQLALCGGESLDRNAGLVGPYLAEFLGIPHVARIAMIQERDRHAIVVQRRTERGDREVIECPLPALVTVDKGINRPRLPTFQAIARARTQAIDKIPLASLIEPQTSLGPSTNHVEVVRLSGPKPRRGNASRADAPRAAADRRSLMMKGGAPKASGGSPLLEGTSDRVLADLERVLKEQGIEFEMVGEVKRDLDRQEAGIGS